MIAYLKGIFIDRIDNEIVLMVNGVGYLVYCTVNAINTLPKMGSELEMHVKMIVREDAMELYGFCNKEEKQFFNLLITISGIGPKTAIGILGSMTVSDLKKAITANDSVSLSQAPGIGKKTASRIILELRDKIDKSMLINDSQDDISVNFAISQDIKSEAVTALKSLGYTHAEAVNAVKTALSKYDNNTTADDIIKNALRAMSSI